MSERTEQRRAFIIDVAYFALVIALVVLGGKYLVPWLLPFIMGYAIAVIFKPIVRFFTVRLGFGPKPAGFVVVILAYAVIGLLLLWGGAKLFSLIRELVSGLPAFYENILEPAIREFGDAVNSILSVFPDVAGASDEVFTLSLQDFKTALLSVSTAALGSLGTMSAKLPGFMLAFFFTIMSSLIISMNYEGVSGFLIRQIPEKYRELMLTVKNDTLKTIGNYLVAYIKIMCVTFVELAVGLTILGVRNSLLVALGIALFDVLPVMGTGGILIPWIIFELLEFNFPMAFGLAVLYAIIAVVRSIVEPRIVGNQLGLHPLATLCAIYAGFKLMGVLGMILFPIILQILAGLHRSGVLKLPGAKTSS